MSVAEVGEQTHTYNVPLRRISAELVASWSPADRQAFYNSLTPEEKIRLNYKWEFWARDNQLPPSGKWRTWLIRAGRGFGKTRTGAEWVRQQVESGRCRRLALVARTAADVRDVVVEGQAGILAVSPPWFRPTWKPALRRLTWPNGAIATTYTGDEPSQLRGPAHDGAWADEVAAWRYPEAWDQLQFGLRIGENPQAVVSTTPRATKIIRDLLKAESTVETVGSTYANVANLSPAFVAELKRRYEGTRLGLQEIHAAVLDDNPNALWHLENLEAGRLRKNALPQLDRVVVAIDPSASDDDSDELRDERAECGIIVAARGRLGGEEHVFILQDASLQASPKEWAERAVENYRRYLADAIVAEVNNGGAMVEAVIRAVDSAKNVSYKSVRASRGKQVRAEPVSALYARGLVHHIGVFPELEDQLCNWTPGEKSPDRLDALVWAVTELLLEEEVGSLKTSSYI